MEWRDGKVWWRCGRCGQYTARYRAVILILTTPGGSQVHGVCCEPCDKWVIYAPGHFPGVHNAARNLRYR